MQWKNKKYIVIVTFKSAVSICHSAHAVTNCAVKATPNSIGRAIAVGRRARRRHVARRKYDTAIAKMVDGAVTYCIAIHIVAKAVFAIVQRFGYIIANMPIVFNITNSFNLFWFHQNKI